MNGRPHRFATLTIVMLALSIAAYASVPTHALAQASRYKEAPMLADLVKAGKLPPVAQRLPEDPLVVNTFESIGQYGGVWRRGFLGPVDSNNYHRIVYDALVRYSPDGTNTAPPSFSAELRAF